MSENKTLKLGFWDKTLKYGTRVIIVGLIFYSGNIYGQFSSDLKTAVALSEYNISFKGDNVSALIRLDTNDQKVTENIVEYFRANLILLDGILNFDEINKQMKSVTLMKAGLAAALDNFDEPVQKEKKEKTQKSIDYL